jgi:L-aspartate oxidase
VTVEHRLEDADDYVQLDVDDVRRSLKALMWRNVGVERSGELLEQADRRIDSWCSYVMRYPFSAPAGWELQNMLTVAKIVTKGALTRTESRGTHYRTDYPERDDAQWQRHIEFSRSGGVR